MELVHAGLAQPQALLGGNRRRHQPVRRRIVVESVEQPRQPVGHAGAALGAELGDGGEFHHRHDARNDRRLDSRGARAVEKPQEHVRAKEELRDRAGRAGVELALEIVEVESGARRVGMDFRVSRDVDFEVADLLQAFHQVGRVGIALRVRLVAADALGQVAAQRHDATDSRAPVTRRDGVDIVTRGARNREMRGRVQRGLGTDAAHGLVRRLGPAGAAAGAARDRDEARPQRLESLDRLPQPLLHGRALRREELERNLGRGRAVRRGFEHAAGGLLPRAHEETSETLVGATSARRSSSRP